MQAWAREYKTLVLLAVRDEGELLAWCEKFRGAADAEANAPLGLAEFREPDLGGALTAVACGPTDNPRPFRRLRLAE